METECILQRCITKVVSIITGIVEYDLFYYTDVFVSLHSLDKEFVADAFQTIPDDFKRINTLSKCPGEMFPGGFPGQ